MIKKIFQILGVVSVVCFSFFYTEKAVNVVKEQDPIMQQIIQSKDKYNTKPIDIELIDKYYIIPGYNGTKIAVDKSYNSMKRLGKFNENLLVYEEHFPKQTINEIYDKYIIKGNKVKNMISLVFKVNDGDSIIPLLNILDNNDVKGTFFLDGKWLEENTGIVKELINKKQELANYGYDNNYNNDFFVWTNNKLKQMKKYKPQYCYVEEEDFTILDLCKNYRMHTIMPNIITRNYPYTEVKNKLEAGSIISFNINDIVTRELNTIIQLIKSKGYDITILSEHLSERRL